MEGVGHSPLLKLIVGDKNTPNMSKPEFLIQESFEDPNITSAVPRVQKLRENASESNITKVPRHLTIDDTTDNLKDAPERDAEHQTILEEEKTVRVERNEKAELTAEDSKEDFTLSPVITVTKEEASFTKGDLKLQKVTVTEDISDTETTTLEEVTVIKNGEAEIQTEVISMQQIRRKSQTNEKEQAEIKKPKTRIPTLRFRQAVDKLKQDRNIFEDKKVPETPPPTPRSAIPRLKDNKTSTTIIFCQPNETPNALPRLSDEFDKLYDEIAEDQGSLDDLSIISKIEDPVKVDNTFEEIIHAYEEKEIQPINVEKVRQSKIPLLKRKSEHEIEVPKQINTEFKQSISVDFSKLKSSENHSKIQSITLNKSPVRTSLISKRISEMQSAQESSAGYFEKVSTVNIATIEEINNNRQPNIVKNEILKEEQEKLTKVNEINDVMTAKNETETNAVKTPDSEHAYENIITQFEDNIKKPILQASNSIEEQNIISPIEEKFTHSVTSTKTTLDEVNNVSSLNIAKHIEKPLSTEELPDNKNEEDIPILKGKVSRIIQRMDSKEADVKQFRKDLGHVTPREKSVLSKIAMFEHHEPTNVTPPITSDYKQAERFESNLESPNDRPKIIDEVLKELPARKIEENNENKTSDSHNIFTKSLDDNEYTTHSKLIDTQPQFDAQHNGSMPLEVTVGSEVGAPESFDNYEDYVEKDKNPNLDMNGHKSPQEDEVLRKSLGETIADVKCEDKSNLSAPVAPNGSHEIKSDIRKQEVKYERMKIDDEIINKDNEEVFKKKTHKDEGPLRIHSYRNNESDKLTKTKSNSLADLDFGIAVTNRVKNIMVRMKSLDKLDATKKEIIDIRERPRKKSVSEKIALFERKLTPVRLNKDQFPKVEPKVIPSKCEISEEEYTKKIEELSLAKTKYGVLDPERMKYLEFRDGGRMPAIGIGTALLDLKLTRYIVQAAIDLGYRTIDTAFIYGNEKEVGEAINEKIKDGTVSRSELFIISKLWSTFHRQDLVERACRASLEAMGLDYFDLYLIHNPMSFKEGGGPIPKIASVIQFSEHDYLDAWFGVERLVTKGLVRRGGVSNFNSQQVDRVVEKGKIKPVMNQVECHPYLSQNRLDDFCQMRNVKLCCFGVLGSKGTPQDYKSALPPAIDDPLVRVMAAGLDVSPAVLLISYQLAMDRGVIVKASSPDRLWNNLQALTLALNPVDVSALHALNRNKRIFTFKGMGDTHRNYPFNIPY